MPNLFVFSLFLSKDPTNPPYPYPGQNPPYPGYPPQDPYQGGGPNIGFVSPGAPPMMGGYGQPGYPNPGYAQPGYPNPGYEPNPNPPYMDPEDGGYKGL